MLNAKKLKNDRIEKVQRKVNYSIKYEAQKYMYTGSTITHTCVRTLAILTLLTGTGVASFRLAFIAIVCKCAATFSDVVASEESTYDI